MIEITNIKKTFSNKIAINDISVDINSNCVTGLIGCNGSGKSTLIKMISTLLKQDSGQILINGIDTVKSPNQCRKKIGLLLGSEITLYSRLSARENIMYFAKLQGMDISKAENQLEKISKSLNMNDFIDRKVFGFSRGMKQKVAFARAIIHSPDILLLDEPSTGLDLIASKEVQDFITYYRNLGKTILLTTHNTSEIDNLCDDLIIIKDGKIIANGSKSELLSKNNKANIADLFFHLNEEYIYDEIY